MTKDNGEDGWRGAYNGDDELAEAHANSTEEQ